MKWNEEIYKNKVRKKKTNEDEDEYENIKNKSK